ncbi:hypothetical protein D3C76_1635620 [compost metagenome]
MMPSNGQADDRHTLIPSAVRAMPDSAVPVPPHAGAAPYKQARHDDEARLHPCKTEADRSEESQG